MGNRNTDYKWSKLEGKEFDSVQVAYKGKEAFEIMKKYNILGAYFDLDLINIFDELSAIDFSQSIESQLMILDEDLLQLSFKSRIIVDVG